ncbi:LysR family transcriptional regulator [Sporolactobacillus sp. CQH2019]|uniref:LysR family transcriptional regulator n=1 Tax=Sporolactobacillus sp. CQH2019 TaxID=3023512 RepID=UPI0023682635|nr:LysR family transcriptional regulator [Sporolactobacillus sp. CQH2019]MDD9150189.1 LysR family transcriptional regulator [Sporolactobacillus sp. CQH2019]
MNFRQLEHFIMIADNMNISTTAKRLGLPQPFLSQQLKKLETDLDTTLLERNTRHMKLTASGKVLYTRGKQLLQLCNVIQQELSAVKTGKKGTLSLGVTPSIGNSVLPNWITSYHEKYPGISFSIEEHPIIKIVSMLEDDLIEFGIIRTPFQSKRYHVISLPSEPMVAVTHSENGFQNNQPEINMAFFINKPILVCKRYEATVKKLCQKYGFEPNISVKVDNTATLLLLAKQGIGIAIIPRDWLELIKAPQIHYCEIKDSELFTRISIIWKKSAHLSIAANNFIQGIRENS